MTLPALPTTNVFWSLIVVGAVVGVVQSTLGNIIYALGVAFVKKLFGNSDFIDEFSESAWRIFKALLLVVGFAILIFMVAGVVNWWLSQPFPKDGEVTPTPTPLPVWPIPPVTPRPTPFYYPTPPVIPNPGPGPEPVYPTPIPMPAPHPRSTKAFAIPDGRGGWFSPFPNDLENGHRKHYPGGLGSGTPMEDLRGRTFYLP